jgi:molybdate transport system substrate-binding protein
MKRTSRLFVVATALVALVAAACGSSSKGASTSASAVQGDITVFAAASLTGSFNDIGAAFTKANPQAHVKFSYDASSALVQQINQGAPADVFASADQANMNKLTKAGNNGTAPVVFANNLLGIIVAPNNPKGIKGVADLGKPALKVVLCAPEVPCGAYAKQILDSAHVTVKPASLEQNVKGVVTKVTTGEADAGIVYVTDIAAAGSKASGVEIPKNINVVAQYPIATTKTSTNTAVDQSFINFVLGSDGQAILSKYGFLPAA